MRLFMAALICCFSFVAVTTQAQARHHHRHHYHKAYDANWNLAHKSPVVRYSRTTHSRVATGFDEAFLPHPAGCPARAFCACGAAVEVFGSAIRSLWPASAWYRFPRTYPAPGMVGVRSHHVFVLRQHIEGSVWLIADYNSGGHQSRLHARSISGYTVVNPHGTRMAMN